MFDLSAHPITRRWPATRPDVIQLYSLPTPNGVKVSVALEEMGLPYEAHLVDISKDDQFTPEFLSLNPNNKIPAMIDPNGPGGKALPLFESGAILIYLAEKTGRFLPQENRYQVLQWLMFQMGGLGPMLGQLGYFHVFAGKEIEDPRPKERYRAESARLLKVLDNALAGQDWIAGDYSIADMAIWPWILPGLQGQSLDDFPNLEAWMARVGERPAVKAGRALGDDLRRNLAAAGKGAEDARKVLFGQRAR
jgi:GST-like protein